MESAEDLHLGQSQATVGPERRGDAVMQLVGGLDGCPGGWVLVEAPADGDGDTTVERVSDLGGVIAKLDSGQLATVAIDIPIGLPEAGSRRCDIEARSMIGARRSSVFPAPARGVLGAATYEDAADRLPPLLRTEGA